VVGIFAIKGLLPQPETNTIKARLELSRLAYPYNEPERLVAWNTSSLQRRNAARLFR